MLIGYACETPDGPDLSDQLRDLVRAGCGPIFIEKLNDGGGERAELDKAMSVARAGDALVAPRLDRLADDLATLIETLETLRIRGVAFLSVAERLDTRQPGAGGGIRHAIAALAAFARTAPPFESAAPKSALGAADSKGSAESPARPRGATPKLSEADIEAAKEMLARGEHTVAEIAEKLGVSRPTLYRHLPRARSSSRS